MMMDKKRPFAKKAPPTKSAPLSVSDRPMATAESAVTDGVSSIVGVGASAGGLDALTAMLRALPVDTGMAFVLVQHLDPTHPSMLAEILSHATTMPVMQVQDEPMVHPNHVYVIPPDRTMIIQRGVLKLTQRPEGRCLHLPIDSFFSSLAEDWGEKAIGVVLSGAGSDGAIGCKAIKNAGGIAFAQDETAQQDSMPKSAIATGCIDYVLSPDQIAQELARIARSPHVASPPEADAILNERDLAEVAEIVRNVTGVDFNQYKTNTLTRRIARRMFLNKIGEVNDYLRFLRAHSEEVQALYQDILINVTSFFRDPDAFAALKSEVFPKLLANRSCAEPVRIWTIGCSTGEEVYSLAMVLVEYLEETGKQALVQIFATDLNAAAINKARAGIYPNTIANEVSPERLHRFFTEIDGHYRVTRAIRDMCVFSRHNVLSDPPFSHVDLISCRNLLIYLDPALQQRVMPLLHYALKPTGYLLLGASETAGAYRDLFEVRVNKEKIFARKPGPAKWTIGLKSKGMMVAFPKFGKGAIADETGVVRASDLTREADRILLGKYAPPGVLINADMEILQFRGDTGPYLAPAPGKASFNLLKMAREGLLVPLRAAVLRAKKEKSAIREEGLRVKSHNGYRDVNVVIIPILGVGSVGCHLVLFDEAPPAVKGRREIARPDARGKPGSTTLDQEAAQRELTHMRQELAETREYLQSLIEQQEAANEEMQVVNEEAQSANEELQSVNEELETSKEEVQSTNEELATLNDELRSRNLELGQTNNDLVNFLNSTSTPIVMLDRDLCIRRITPIVETILNIRPTDVGRPIGDINLKIDVSDLEGLLKNVIKTASVRECEVQDKDGAWYLLRVQPYKTLENKITGAMLILIEVDALKQAQEFAENIVSTVSDPLLVLDAQLRVKQANRAFYKIFGVTREETENHFLYDLGEGQWDIPALRRLLEDILPSNNAFEDYTVEHKFRNVGRKTMLLNGRRMFHARSASSLILLAIRDITEATPE